MVAITQDRDESIIDAVAEHIHELSHQHEPAARPFGLSVTAGWPKVMARHFTPKYARGVHGRVFLFGSVAGEALAVVHFISSYNDH